MKKEENIVLARHFLVLKISLLRTGHRYSNKYFHKIYIKKPISLSEDLQL